MNKNIFQIINTNNILKLAVLLIPIFINRNVHEFRVNQEMLLKLLLIIALALWAVETLNKKKFVYMKNSLNLPFLLLIGLMTISLVRSEYFAVSLKDYVIFLSYFILYFLVINNINREQQFDIFIKLFFFTSFVVALFALLHYYGLDPYLKDMTWLISTIGQKNWTSNYLAMVFPTVFSYFLLEKNNRKIIYYLLLSILYAILIIFQSRGVWISAGLTLILGIFFLYKYKLFNILKKNKKWLFLLFITFILITVIYSIPSDQNPLNKNIDTIPQKITSVYENNFSSLDSRLLMWNTALKMIKDKPFLGIGIGLFKMDYLVYQADFLEQNPNYLKYHSRAEEAHNEYFQLAAELGIIGLGIFLYILFIFYRSALKFLNEKKGRKWKKENLILWGLLMGITCFLFHSMFTFPLHVPALGSAFFVIFALTFLYINNFFNLEQQDQLKTKKDEKKKDRREKSKKKKNKNIRNKKFKVTYIYIILVLFLMVIAINFLVIKPYIADIAYFKGVKYYSGGNYQKALHSFEQAAKLNPYDGRILYSLGSTYYYLKNYSKAEEILKRAVNYIKDKYLFINLGMSYMKLGNQKEAEDQLLQAVYIDSQFIGTYLNLAHLYSGQQNYDQAITNWLKVLEIKPDYSERYKILYNLGLMYQRKKMPYKALFYFKQALDSAPEDGPHIENITKEIKRLESE